MINYQIELDMSWLRNCVISEISRTAEVAANPPKLSRRESETTGATFKMKNAKLYVPIVTLSMKDNINVLENIKQGFKRIISWNKYRSEVTRQPKNNKLDYMIYVAFMNISGLFVLLFNNVNDYPRLYSDKYYMVISRNRRF